jgi:hypothetical protein
MAKNVTNTENAPETAVETVPGIAPVQPITGIVRQEDVRALVDVLSSVWGWVFPLSRVAELQTDGSYRATVEVLALADDESFAYRSRLRELCNA